MRLDGVRLQVVDVPAVLEAYRRLLGIGSTGLADGVERFQLPRGAVEFVAGSPGAAVCFAAERGDDLGAWPAGRESHGGLDVRVISEPPVEATTPGDDGVLAIDHIVVQTVDPERVISHWRDRLGLRLAFDREFPERSLRLLFFRSGGITLEFATPLEGKKARTAPDVFYGLSYRVGDVEACSARLTGTGVDVGDVHAGLKEGTRVATVRSGTAGIPTLLIEDSART
jgi:catechol 2,3-dioxygenase-like lactoylglutathione lyase family enzyme